jgi:hypothetical protein
MIFGGNLGFCQKQPDVLSILWSEIGGVPMDRIKLLTLAAPMHA